MSRLPPRIQWVLRTMQYRFQFEDKSGKKPIALTAWKQSRSPFLAVASLLLLLISGRFLIIHFHIGLSLTDSSSAEGFYRLIDAPVRRGELVAACLPADIEHEGLDRGYLRAGECSGGAEAVLKIVGALPGDELDIEPDRVSINGTALTNSLTLSRDTANRPLAHARWGRRAVAPDEVWIFGFNNRRSWDSRYFGPITLRAIRGVAEPLMTW